MRLNNKQDWDSVVEYAVTVGGFPLYPQKLRFTRTVDFYTLGDFTLTLPEEDPRIDLDQTVEIYRNNIIAFRGRVETLKTYETGTETGTNFDITGRDMRLLLLRRITGRQIWKATEPATIFMELNTPNYLLASQPGKMTLTPDQDTYIDTAYPNTSYDTSTELICTNPKFDATRERRVLVRFPLDDWWG